MKTTTAFLILLSSLVFFSCRDNDPGGMPVVKRDGTVLNYKIAGDGGSTLLFVHGAYADQTYWDEQVKYFSPDYKVVTFDLSGHGKSGKNRMFWSVEGFADDVYAIIKKLNLKNVILIGHSLGADVNLLVATSHPRNIIGFISIDNFKNAATPMPAKFEKQKNQILRALKKDFAGTNEQYARMALMTPETPAPIADKIAASFRNAYKPMGEDIMPEIFGLYKREQLLMPRMTHKMHLINVDYLPIKEKPLKKYAGNGYEVLHMKGTCHYPMYENPQLLNKLLQQSIEEIANENDMAKR